MEPGLVTATRRAMHGAAELVLAGPQYRKHGTIRLRVTSGGFSTVIGSEIRVDGDRIVNVAASVALSGRTLANVAARVGVEATALDDVYPDGSGVSSDEVIQIDAVSARWLCRVFEVGHAALLAFSPDSQPVLWPEHFDVSIDARQVNYGVSPGDQAHQQPYAYVGPWETRRGAFWNAPFGAMLTIDGPPDVDAMAEFFRTGERLASGGAG